MERECETSWWLDWSALPGLFWARMRTFPDGSAEVLDLDGWRHHFTDRESAVFWLSEDEYSQVEQLIKDGEVAPDVVPPGDWP